MRGVSLFLFISLGIGLTFCHGQDKFESIKGTIVNAQTSEKLAFATVYNYSTKEATISNLEGYFELKINAYTDSVVVSYVGFKAQTIALETSKIAYEVPLEENVFQLKAVSIIPKDYSFIYDLLEACKKKQSESKKTAKAYYQLKSYLDKQQIELVEGFYNARIKGYNLLSTSLKAGRLGLRENNERLFASLESSKPIKMHQLFSESKYFPLNPLELSKKRLRKDFVLDYSRCYRNEQEDSIHLVFFYPKKDRRHTFSCKLWINASDTSLLKVELWGRNLETFPLIPIYEGDYLSDRDLHITKTFKKLHNEMFFEHVDFEYHFRYHKKDKSSYEINSHAILFAYDYEESFQLPEYPLINFQLTDYQYLSALPHNSFFWQYNNELSLHDALDSNQLFMNDPATINNQGKGGASKQLATLVNYSSVEWRKTRVAFDILPQHYPGQNPNDDYSLAIDIFLDYNHYEDSSNVLTKTIFKVQESYFRPLIGRKENCFFNLYFDLVEIERRKLEEAIQHSDRSLSTIKKLYAHAQKELSERGSQFLEEVMLGQNEEAMRYWNEYVKTKLGIDNIASFELSLEGE